MKTFQFDSHGSPVTGRFVVAKYGLGGVAVDIESEMEDAPDCWEPYTSLSCRLPATDQLPEGAFYTKHWSENDGLILQLLDLGLIERVLDAKVTSSGHIPRIYAHRLTPKGYKHVRA